MTIPAYKLLNVITRGSLIKRYHTRQSIHIQNNAEHQFFVVSIALILYPEMGMETLRKILWHDIYEYETGDMPWLIKRNHPDLKNVMFKIEHKCRERDQLFTEVTTFEHTILKLSEYFECLLFCLRERRLGNSEFDDTIQDCIGCILEINDKTRADSDCVDLGVNSSVLLREVREEGNV